MHTFSLHSKLIYGYGLLLALLMAATRFHHEGTAFALPDASLGVFFLVGFLLNNPRVFWVYLALAFMVDFLAVTAFDVGDYCISPAYVFLVPTYAAMHWGGKWLKCMYNPSFTHFALNLAVSLGLSVSLAFLISNASFYWLSGKVPATGFLDYLLALMGDFPPYMGATLVYVLTGLGIVAVLRHLSNFREHRVGGLKN